MCGLLGVLSTGDGGIDWPASIRAGLDRIRHRGPDDEGLFVSAEDAGPRVVLGHLRLSVIDLESGHQPMRDDVADLTLVYNGEIYNFPELRAELASAGCEFHTRSDTEVILRAYREWGIACVERLNGMFAFALWDGRRRRLLLARDRFGEKPLFLAHAADGALVFASEVKALRGMPGLSPTLDVDALAAYLLYRYVPGPATLLREVRKLQPGSVAVWENGTLNEHVYYRPPDRSPTAGPAPADPVAAFAERLAESVRMRMIADVPFGAFLSGGIDSSVIVGLMSACSNTPVRTFSVGFRESAYSELGFARTVARHFGTEHHELEISHAELMEHLPALVHYRDAPVSEPSDIPIYLLAREARRSVKMVLTGEGSDEILGGYPKHVFERWSAGYRRVPRALRHRLVEPLIGALPYRYHRAKTAIRNLGLERAEARMPGWFGALAPGELARLAPGLAPPARSPSRASFDVEAGTSALRRILYFDQTSWLPDNLLERGDRMSMAASLEARVPFLDHELAALVSTLPDRCRVRGLQTKWLLRRAAQTLLPAQILRRPKVGFRLPVNEWFRTSMREYLRAHLLGGDAIVRGFVDAGELELRVHEHLSGRHNHEKLLWTLLTLELWCRGNRDWVHL